MILTAKNWLIKTTAIIGLLIQLSQASDPQTIHCVAPNTRDAIAFTQIYTGGELDDVIVTLDTNNFIGIEFLVVGQNSFKSFPSKLCSAFPNLKQVYLNSNHLTFITQDAFKFCGTVATLIIENENIPTIKDDTFSKLVNLQFFSLFTSQVSTFEPFSFRGLHKLEGLTVVGNALTSLPAELLKDLSTIQNVDFENNGIVEIPKGFLNDNPHLQTFNFNENVDRFCKALFSGTTELQNVDLSNNPCVGSKSSFIRSDYDSYQMFIDDILANTENCIDSCGIIIEDCTAQMP